MSEITGMEHESNLGKYLHVKTEEVYDVVSTEIINATNSSDSEEMVLYKNFDDMYFVREYDEFFDGRFIKMGD